MSMKPIFAVISSTFVILLTGYPNVPKAPVRPALREIANGIIEHSASGMQFPLTCGNFSRAGVRQYDARGLDVSAAYNPSSPDIPIVITAYVYPSPSLRSIGSPKSVVDEARRTLAQGEFQRCKDEITRVHAGARLASESEITSPSVGLTQGGYFACYTFTDQFAGRIGPVESLLYVFCYAGDGWTIKFRVTYPKGVDARTAVNRFLQDLPWTVKGPNH
jgi:hypothetical protein